MFRQMFGKKSWYHSLTAWGVVILVAAEAAVAAGLLPPEAARYVQILGGVAATLGIRKAASAPNTG